MYTQTLAEDFLTMIRSRKTEKKVISLDESTKVGLFRCLLLAKLFEENKIELAGEIAKTDIGSLRLWPGGEPGGEGCGWL